MPLRSFGPSRAAILLVGLVALTGCRPDEPVARYTAPKDPTDTATWSTLPRNIRTFSSTPVLGGAANTGIVLK